MYLRDRIISFCGLGVLFILVSASAYYAIKATFSDGVSEPNKESPDFATRDCVITEFDADGSAKNRIFAEYVEHYSDGRSVSIRPRFVTLSPDQPQLKISANTASTTDDGETIVLTGNILLTRAGDKETAPIRLTTSHAVVRPDEQIITGDVPIRLEHGGDISTGIGFAYDNVERTIRLDSDVRTFIMPRNEPN